MAKRHRFDDIFFVLLGYMMTVCIIEPAHSRRMNDTRQDI
ncbi:hypothetical protein BSU6633_19007 [Bacillus spizizenii ATCC 6633 = JCM 2499]|nr:hypothetical protein BSU6633_19007 [Bacillus spizizenii ATCC 6633 = JCM 2499]